MRIIIKQLTPALSSAYFDFFEIRAFADGSPYRCYCQMYQMTREQAAAAVNNASGTDMGWVSKNAAQAQIQSGALRGYLAFDGDMAVGWCNCNAKANFPLESSTGDCFYASPEKREKAVVCFEIAPEYRGKGIATALLQRAVADAKAEGYIAVEGFPVLRNERYEWDSAGPVRLYEKAGFVKVLEKDGKAVMRKVVACVHSPFTR